MRVKGILRCCAVEFKKKDGMASLLVIFTVIILALFAVLTFATAKANMRLSEKVAFWTKEYYSLDSFAEERRQEFENMFWDAESFTVSCIADGGYLDAGYTGLPGGVIELEAWQAADDEEREALLLAAAERVYVYKCIEIMERAKKDMPELIVELPEFTKGAAALLDVSAELPEQGSMRIGYLVSQQQVETPKMLSVTLELNMPSFEIEKSGGAYALKRHGSFVERFAIVEWAEYQQPFDMDGAQQWWDGAIEEYVQ
ncbi:MAG: hypothetical protein ACOYJD_02005 [Christensenellales bacterium]|jgi:hypothetical protein